MPQDLPPETPETLSPEYLRLKASMDAWEMWEELSTAERLEVIITTYAPLAWAEPDTLAILAEFRTDAIVWMRIKAQGKAIGVNVFDLEKAVDALRATRQNGARASTGTPRPAPPGFPSSQHAPSEAIRADEWRELLIVTAKEHTPTENASNIGLILAHHAWWQEKLWWDEVRGRAMVGTQVLSDKLITEIAQWMGRVMRMPVKSLRLLERCLLARCQEMPRDLLQEWLDSLPTWDQVARLDSWLCTIAGAEETDYGRAISRIVPLSMVARARVPGCLFRYVVILEGPEASGKSSLVRALAGEGWSVELSIGLESKESHMMLQGTWVAEMPELDSLSRTEETRLKAFITLTEDSYIPKFSNNRVRLPRRSIFIGTTNEESYLKGQSGNTRFLPIRTGTTIDLPQFEAIRDQLFAEACAVYATHQRDWWQLADTALARATEERESRRVVNEYEAPLQAWLAHRRTDPTEHIPSRARDKTDWPEIAKGFLEIPTPERWKDKALQMQIAAALRALKWRSVVERDQGTVARYWLPPEHPAISPDQDPLPF